jgi:predicted Zn-dependent peptidase
MFEHMAFKGTDKIGTTDYNAERAALDKIEQT